MRREDAEAAVGGGAPVGVRGLPAVTSRLALDFLDFQPWISRNSPILQRFSLAALLVQRSQIPQARYTTPK